ncbi:RING-H2 finger protein ATL77-like [Wolffia australiana]
MAMKRSVATIKETDEACSREEVKAFPGLFRSSTVACPQPMLIIQANGFASSVPTEEEVLQLLWTRNYSPAPGKYAEPCAICLEDFEMGEEVATLRCCHSFHARCIARWLTQSNNCPLCKSIALMHPR